MKNRLRTAIKSKRDLLTRQEIDKSSKIIKDKLFSLPGYKKSKTILYYVSFGSEVNTHDMIMESLQTKSVVVPKLAEKGLSLSKISSFHDLDTGAYGILEPKRLKIIDEKEIDLIIVPGIAFDKNLHRIGFGHGNYDSLLKKFPNVEKVALAFSVQIVDRVPEEKHDIKVDKIITEEEIIQ
jgi:5-formyltetrahydrofolate cyclo-ligase